MAKKTKLKYDFNTTSNLEIQIPSGTWCRVTSSDFRSSGHPRRINNEPYDGLIYYKDTNIVVENPEPKINYPEGYIHMQSKKNR
jgi:hypothetical protein